MNFIFNYTLLDVNLVFSILYSGRLFGDSRSLALQTKLATPL